MAHFLWNLHLSGFIITFFILLFSDAQRKLRYSVWKSPRYSKFKKIILSLACVVAYVIMAFVWEFSLPYEKSDKFRDIYDTYLNYWKT